jgi:hypothetical protein
VFCIGKVLVLQPLLNIVTDQLVSDMCMHLLCRCESTQLHKQRGMLLQPATHWAMRLLWTRLPLQIWPSPLHW